MIPAIPQNNAQITSERLPETLDLSLFIIPPFYRRLGAWRNRTYILNLIVGLCCQCVLGVNVLMTTLLHIACNLSLKTCNYSAFSAKNSLTLTTTTCTIGTRRHWPSYPLHLCHFSEFSGAIRRIKMSIRRFLGSIPPAISAEIIQKLHKLRRRSPLGRILSIKRAP